MSTNESRASAAMRNLDKAIGARIRSYRQARKMSQGDIGKLLGVTFQQVQKYENGKNRVSGSRLVRLCEILNVRPEQILGNGHGVYSTEPDVLSVLRHTEMTRMLVEINKLPQSRRKAVVSALVLLVRAFAGAPKGKGSDED